MTSIDEAKKLLGKDVIVAIGPEVVVRGQLLSFSDGGEFVVRDGCGFNHHCWPWLEIKEA